MSDTPPGDDDPGNIERLSEHRRRRRPSRIRDATDDAAGLAARLATVRMMIGDSPYEPVGFDGHQYWIIDSTQSLRGAAPRDIGPAWLDSICGASPYLRERYPRTRKGQPVGGFVADNARRDLMNACNIMGFWQPSNVRGAGAWLGADGDLVLHRGDHLWIRGARRALGRVGDFVYVPGPPLPPLPKLTPAMRPAHHLLDRLETFRFTRGSFDALLVLGILCVSCVAGALAFRPHLFVVGEIDTGKTTLQKLIRATLGIDGIVDVTDASAASIWQSLNWRSLPIGYDEFEAEADPKRQERILALARQASTGAKLRRGSASHTATEFPVVSNFICSSIIAPPLNAADASRFVIITTEILKLLSGDEALPRTPFTTDRLAEYGAQLTARLAQQWPLLHKEVLPAIRDLMSAQGYPGRVIDLYGTLLGLLSVALHDKVEDMNLAGHLAGFQMQRLLTEAQGQQIPEWRRCLDFLLSARTERNRHTSTQFGELIQAAAAGLMSPGSREQLTLWGASEDIPQDIDGAARSAQRILSAFGLRVARVGLGNASENLVLQVAHANSQLAELFEETRWRTSAESATGGGWTQALRRAPGATISGGVRFRVGVQSRSVQVPIAVVLQRPVSPDPGQQPAAGEPAADVPGVLH